MNAPNSQARFAQAPNQCGGFTLIELITVMVILAIIAVIGTNFIVSSTEAYNSTQTRAKLVNQGRQAVERITRQLRGALPNSIQLTAGNTCIQFLPLASGGFYTGQVPDSSNGAAATNAIATLPYRVDFGSARYAIIGALSAGDIYGGGSLANLAAPIAEGNSASNLALSANKVWQRNSVSQRFYLVDNPQAFCVVGGQLSFLQGNAIGWTPAGADVIMAGNVNGTFALQAGTEARNTIVTLDLDFTEGGETVNLLQEVHIRNVP